MTTVFGRKTHRQARVEANAQAADKSGKLNIQGVLAAAQVVAGSVALGEREGNMNGIEQCQLRQPRAHWRIHARVFDHRAGEQQAGFPSDIGVRVGQCNDGRAAVFRASPPERSPASARYGIAVRARHRAA